MSKKNSSVILKKAFLNNQELYSSLLDFKIILEKIRNKNFLIAVSGGPDSLALTALAKACSYEKKYNFKFALVNHNIRANSSKEAISVKKLLSKHGIPLVILKNKKLINKNIQGSAREVRYNLLKEYCRKKKLKNIITAHNLEDQVETFLIRLSRGSGLQGLSSMRQINKIDKNIHLIRPLLNYKKIQLIKITKTIFGKFFKDPTNKNKKYLRSRVRELKKPLENSGINYLQIIKSINNLAASRDTLDNYFKTIYKDIVRKEKNKIYINLNSFNALNTEIKIRIIQQSIKEVSKIYYFTRAKKILNLISRIDSGKDKNLYLSSCQIKVDKKYLIIKKKTIN
tara:strand:+ start:479 stop:1501 length:1023 start_codon:yes stop_codon:yes gene_type:complete